MSINKESKKQKNYSSEKVFFHFREQKLLKPNKIANDKISRRWTDSIDLQIMELIDKNGKNWKLISKELGNIKTAKEIQNRYENRLNPEINRSPFSKKDDTLIIELLEKYGRDWDKIAEHLSNKPPQMIKNRYYSYLKQFELKKNAIKHKQTQKVEKSLKNSEEAEKVKNSEENKQAEKTEKQLKNSEENQFSKEEQKCIQPPVVNYTGYLVLPVQNAYQQIIPSYQMRLNAFNFQQQEQQVQQYQQIPQQIQQMKAFKP